MRVTVGSQTASSGPLATGVVLAAAAATEGNGVLRSLCDATGLLDAACRAIDATVRSEAVFMTAYTFDLDPIVEALVRAKGRGVRVMLLLDLDCNANGKTRNQPAAVSRLVAHGVAVRCAQGKPLGDMYGDRYRSSRGHLHTKMVLAARTKVVGSFNWTNSSTNNLEMGSVVELPVHPFLKNLYPG